MLSRKQIIEINDIKTEEVNIPEWGDSVFVRGMTGAERDTYEATVVEQNGKNTKVNLKNARARLAIMTVVDEDGNRLFTPADLSILSGKNAAALDRIFAVASRLSGIGNDDMEELSKNSIPGQSEDFTLD